MECRMKSPPPSADELAVKIAQTLQTINYAGATAKTIQSFQSSVATISHLLAVCFLLLYFPLPLSPLLKSQNKAKNNFFLLYPFFHCR